MSKTYEMMWDCGFCGSSKLLGKTHRYCPGCGAAQDPSTRYFPPEDEKVAVEDHEFVGADKICPSCDAPNSAKAACCTNCGSPMDGSKQVKIQQDDAEESEAKESTNQPPGPPKKSNLPMIIGVIVVLAIICGILSMWSEEKEVSVTGHSWTRSIDIEEFQRTDSATWQDKIPTGAIKGTCTTKENPSKTKKVEDGQECNTVKKDKGDGTYTETEKCETKYKEIPQNDQWCKYQIDEWKLKDTKKASGNDLEPKWPEVTGLKECSVNQLGCQKQGSKKEEYFVLFSDPESKEHKCSFDENKWKSIAVGTKKTMEFGIAGGIDCDSFDKAK